MTTGLKFFHLAAISIWAAGLICLPFLFRQRRAITTRAELHRMHAFVRYLFVVILSPAAFVAIGTGIALIFLRQAFEVWFTIKLAFVGVLVGIHIGTGLVILKVFDAVGHYPAWRYYTFTMLTILVVTAILVVVLAKPPIDALDHARGLFVPGALGETLDPLIRRLRP